MRLLTTFTIAFALSACVGGTPSVRTEAGVDAPHADAASIDTPGADASSDDAPSTDAPGSDVPQACNAATPCRCGGESPDDPIGTLGECVEGQCTCPDPDADAGTMDAD